MRTKSRIVIATAAMITVAVATVLILRFFGKVPYDSWAYQIIGAPLSVIGTLIVLGTSKNVLLMRDREQAQVES